MVKRTCYDEVDFVSAEDWKCVSAAVLKKYAVSTNETNPNVLFKMKQQSALPRAEKIYVKPPIGRKPLWLEEE